MLLAILAMPIAQAIHLQTTKQFALTRTSKVAWVADQAYDFVSIAVNATSLILDSIQVDWNPGKPTDNVTVHILSWSTDNKTFQVLNSTSVTSSLIITNTGVNLTTFGGGVASQICVTGTTPCVFNFASSTNNVVSVTTLSTSGANGGRPLDTIPPQGGSSTFPTPPTTTSSGPGINVPSPAEVFPQLRASQWWGIALGLVLVWFSFPRTRSFLPRFVQRLPFAPAITLPLGVVLLTIIYLTGAKS